MSKRTTTKQAMPSEVWAELDNLKSIIALAAFASDARRTLEGIDEVKRWHPETDERIKARVAASCNWDTHENTLPAVLTHVTDRIQDLLNNSTEA